MDANAWTDLTGAYRKVTGSLIDFLFDLNVKLVGDIRVIRADMVLTAEHKAFAMVIENRRREAIEDLCVFLSAQETYDRIPTAAARQWLLNQMAAIETDVTREYLWLGYRYVENMVGTFEREFERRLGA